MTIDILAKIGGVFALLTLLHFVADWVFQSHAEAMAKPLNAFVRARHCAIYTVICCGVIAAVARPHWHSLAWSAGILFVSHFAEDTYLPVYVWARYIRRPPEMFLSPRGTQNQGSFVLQADDFKIIVNAPDPGMREFKAFVETPLGKILLIAIDQIVHLLFLLFVAGMLVEPEYTTRIGICGAAWTALLISLSMFGSFKLWPKPTPKEN